MTERLYDAPKTGGDTLAWCTKCKMDLAHVIVSMIGPAPAKVICKTCKSQHNFRSAQGDLALPGMPRKPKPRAKEPKAVVRAADHWETKMAQKSAATLLPYSPKEIFQLGDVIKHPTFGVGLIEEVRKGGKMVVLFREGDKLLVFGMGQPNL